MRSNIFDLLNDSQINLKREYERIYELFEKTRFSYKNSILDYINDYEFHNWKYRGRFLDTDDIMIELRITNCNFDIDTNMDRLITYIEFIINMLSLIKTYFFDNFALKTITMLKENINNLLEDLNYKVYENKNEQYIIIEKDIITTAIAETMPDICDDVIEYRRFSLKGDIKSKKEILLKLADKIEPLREKFKGTNYKNILEDINMLLNNLNIRHNNLEGPKKNDYTVNMTEEVLENWYDKTYDMILGAFILEDYIDNKDALAELKSHF